MKIFFSCLIVFILISQTASAETDVSAALRFFHISTGEGGADSCVSCNSVALTFHVIANFSRTVYSFFQNYFFHLAPVIFAILVAYDFIVTGLVANNTKAFVFGFLKKCAGLFFLWAFLIGNATVTSLPSATSAYDAVGPNMVSSSFSWMIDARNNGLQALGKTSIPAYKEFDCSGAQELEIDIAAEAVRDGVCIIERTHALGLSISIALVQGAFVQAEFKGPSIVNFVLMLVTGFAIMALFAYSFGSMLLVLIDVVFNILMTASFLGLFLLSLMTKPTRQYAVEGFQHLIVAHAYALALGLGTTLGFVLIAQTPVIYNYTYEAMSPLFQRELMPIEATTPFAQMEEFIKRIQLPGSVEESLPAIFWTPWTATLLLSCFMMVYFTKRLVNFVENIMQSRGATSAFDMSRRITATSASLAAKGGLLGILGSSAIAQKAEPTVKHMSGIAAGHVFGRTAAAFGNQKMQQRGLDYASSHANRYLETVSPFGRLTTPSGGSVPLLHAKAGYSYNASTSTSTNSPAGTSGTQSSATQSFNKMKGDPKAQFDENGNKIDRTLKEREDSLKKLLHHKRIGTKIPDLDKKIENCKKGIAIKKSRMK